MIQFSIELNDSAFDQSEEVVNKFFFLSNTLDSEKQSKQKPVLKKSKDSVKSSV